MPLQSNTFEDFDYGVYNPCNLDYPNLPMPNLPKLSLIVLTSLSMLCLNATAQQVYQSVDEQGNVSFSDTPTSGSKAVTIEAPNLSDAVETPPPSQEAETAPAPASQPATASGEVPADLSTIDDDDDYDDGDWYGRRDWRRYPHLHRQHRRR